MSGQKVEYGISVFTAGRPNRESRVAISEFEVKKCEREVAKFLENRRPPEHVRSQLDFGFRIEDQSVELFEVRPKWNDPEVTLEIPFAKATFVKKDKLWKVYWQRQDLKWHRYSPVPAVQTIEAFLAVVGEDENACFFG